jgi:hypothetical protein
MQRHHTSRFHRNALLIQPLQVRFCKGSNTTTTQSGSTPNPVALSAYDSLIGQAQNIAQTPFIPYTNQQIAPLTNEQNAAIGGINSYANAAQGGISAAEGLVGQSTGLLSGAAGLYQNAAQPLTTNQINQYMSPYTQDVVNATEAQFNLQNAQQQNQVVGNAASVGALGGNRIGVAQAQLAGQQQANEAPVIAGLYNQAYTTGLGTAEQEFQQNPMAAAAGLGNTAAGYSNAAYGLGSLATAGQNAGLQGAGAQFQAGTAQQQTQQAIDTNAFNYYLMQAGYPEQMLNWESGIVSGVGSLMGGTGYSTTTGPPPNQTAQYLGLGLGALGVFSDRRLKENIRIVGHLKDGQPVYRYNYKGDPNKTIHVGLMADQVRKSHPEAVHRYGGFDAVNYGEATKDAAKRARGGVAGLGAPPAYQYGGAPMGVGGFNINAGPYGETGMPYGGGPTYVPAIQITHGSGPPQVNAPGLPQQQQAGAMSPSQIMQLNKSLQGFGNTGLGQALGMGDDWAGGGEPADLDAGAILGESRGGSIPHYAANGGSTGGFGTFSGRPLPPQMLAMLNRSAQGRRPIMMSRAQGGTIRHYDDGGNVPDNEPFVPDFSPTSPHVEGGIPQLIAPSFNDRFSGEPSPTDANPVTTAPVQPPAYGPTYNPVTPELPQSLPDFGVLPGGAIPAGTYGLGVGPLPNTLTAPQSVAGQFPDASAGLGANRPPIAVPPAAADLSQGDVIRHAADFTARRETGHSVLGGVGNISPDAGHSFSYGPFGWNSKTGSAGTWAQIYGKDFGITAAPGTALFNQQWKNAAATDRQGMADALYDYYSKDVWPRAQKTFDAYGVPNNIKNDPRAQIYMADRYIQMGDVGLDKAMRAAGYDPRTGAVAAQSPDKFLSSISTADHTNLGRNFPTYLSEYPQNVPGLQNRIAARDSLRGGVPETGDASAAGSTAAYTDETPARRAGPLSGPSDRPVTPGLGAAPSQPSGVAPPSGFGQTGLLSKLNFLGLAPEERAGLLSAGMGMLASRSPFLGVAVGEGAQAGLGAYAQATTRDLAVRRLGIEADKARSAISLQGAQTENLRTQGAISRENLRLYQGTPGVSGPSGTAPVTPVQPAPLPAPAGGTAAIPQAVPPPAGGVGFTPQAVPAPTTPQGQAPAPLTSQGEAPPAMPASPATPQQPNPQLDPRFDPAALRLEAQHIGWINPARATFLNKQAEDIEHTGISRDIRGNVVPLPGYANAKAAGELPAELQKQAIADGHQRLLELRTAGSQADASRQELSLQKSLVNDPYFIAGSGQEWRDSLRRLAVSSGVYNPDRATPGEVYDKLRSSGILDQIKGMKGTGPVRVSEMKFIDKMIAGRENSPQAIRDLVEIEDRVAARSQHLRTMANDYRKTHPYLDDEFENQANAYMNDPKNALFSKEELADPRLIAPPKFATKQQLHAAHLPPGYPFTVEGVDGLLYAK